MATKEQKMVRVVATARGHDGTSVREPGDEFDMPESVFEKRERRDDKGKPSGEFYPEPSWFKKVVDKAAKTGPADGSDIA